MNLVLSEKKKELLEGLLEDGMVLIALDGRRPGLDLPPRLRGDPQVRLNLSYRFGLPIDLGEWGVHATLTFGGVPYDCKLPWSAIYLAFAHGSEEQFLFPADVPEDLLDAQEETKDGQEEEPAEPAPQAEKPRPRFALVQGGISNVEPVAAEGDDEQDAAQEEGSRTSHLRRIK